MEIIYMYNSSFIKFGLFIVGNYALDLECENVIDRIMLFLVLYIPEGLLIGLIISEILTLISNNSKTLDI